MIFDLDAYCRRIGYTGQRAATLETLQAVHLLHPLTFAFENLDPLLGREVLIEPDALQRKLVRDGRGGYCYEQNLLFANALRALGFDVTELAARVVWLVPPGHQLPRTHLLLLVAIDGERYVADVGFGGNVLTAPLRLAAKGAQQTPHGKFGLVPERDGFLVQAEISGEWTGLYRFDFAEQVMGDHEQGNWFVSTHPRSRFRTGLLVARPDAKRRLGLFNNICAIHSPGMKSQKTVLATAAELRDALTDVFGIRLPDDPKLEGVLAHFAGGGGEWKQ